MDVAGWGRREPALARPPESFSFDRLRMTVIKKGVDVIALTRLNGHPVMVNSDLIEQLEETPDTVVTLTSGNRMIVRDSMNDIQQKIIDFKRRIYAPER